MKKKILIVVAVIGVLGIGFYISSFFLFAAEENVPEEELGDPYGIEYFTVPDMEQVFINGVVKPEQSQEFRREESLGEVGELQVSNGESVEEGTTLFTYENTEIAAQLNEMTNQAKRAETQRANFIRRREIAIKNWNDTPEEERMGTLEEINLEYETNDMDAEITEIYNNIERLKAERFTDVNAPFSGKVYIPEEKTMESPILKLISDNFYVSGTVNEKDVERLSVDQTVDIKVISTEVIVTGKVSFIDVNPSEDAGNDMGYYDPSSSTMSNYPVKLSLDTLEGIRNGNNVQATINIGDSVVSIPSEAIYEDGEENYVLVNDFGTVVRRIIQVGEEQDGETIVTSGLEAEDAIIVSSEVAVEEGEMIDESGIFEEFYEDEIIE